MTTANITPATSNAFAATITELANELGMTIAEFYWITRRQLSDSDWDGGQIDLYSVYDALEIDYVAKYLRYALDAMVPHIEHHSIETMGIPHQLHPGKVEDCRFDLCVMFRSI